MSMADVSSDTLVQANQLLRWLTERSESNFDDVMARTLTQDEYEWNTEQLTRRLEAMNLNAPYGAVAAGTGFVKEQAGLSGPESQSAIRLLKMTNRLHQCGRGRGKALVILRPDPIHANEFSADLNTEAESVAAAPAPSFARLLRQAQDLYTRLYDAHEETVEALGQAKARIAQLEAENTELRESQIFTS